MGILHDEITSSSSSSICQYRFEEIGTTRDGGFGRSAMCPKEDQLVLHGPVVHREEYQPVLYRPIMHREEDQLAPCFVHTKEDQLVPCSMQTEEDYGRRMHLDKDQPGIEVYRKNHVSVVKICSSSNTYGSGFMWDKMGHIVSNCHVIQNASNLRVTIFDETSYDAKVVGSCKDKDVAVLHVENLEDKVKPISICCSAKLYVGQLVFAIGSPLGCDQSLTDGIISKLHKEIRSQVNGRPIQDVIQTTASINPGSSGGPLFDKYGSLIGINTAIPNAPSGLNHGVAYSISIHSVRGIIDQLVRDGKVLNPHLGITLSRVPLPGESNWLLVTDVAVDGPAAKAGLRKTNRHASILGDIIKSVNGKEVTNSDDFFKILNLCKAGDKVTVGVLRGNRKKNISITLELNPDESESDVMLSRNLFKC